MKIKTYEQAFDLINVAYTDKAKQTVIKLNDEGYNKSSICYSIWKASDKLMDLRGHSSFWNILVNEVRKHGYKSNIIKG
jgi:hypothetical protein